MIKEYPIDCYRKDGSLIDPGKGHRLLRVGEQVKDGDEYFSSDFEEWVPDELDYPIVEQCDAPMRRKLENGVLEDYPSRKYETMCHRTMVFQDHASFLKEFEELRKDDWFFVYTYEAKDHFVALLSRPIS